MPSITMRIIMPDFEVKIVVYTPTDLQAWKLEPQTNLQQIYENQRVIADQERALGHLRRSLQSKENRISWLRIQLNMLRSQDRLYWHNHHCHHPYYRDYYYRYNIIDGAALYALENDLFRMQMDCDQIRRDMRPYQNIKAEAQSKIHQLEARNHWLAKHIPAAESFLATLENNPAQLVSALKVKIIKTINEYEEKHFIKRSRQVRISLWQIHNSLELLAPDVYDKREQQLNYLRLCGYLGNLYANVALENKDKDFLSCLAQIMNSTHVHSQGDLPGRWKTNSNALVLCQAMKEKYPQAFAKLEQDLEAREHAKFTELQQQLLDPSLICKTNVQQKVFLAAQTLRAEVDAKMKKNEVIDFHFYTRIATNLLSVYHNPTDFQAAKYLGDMATHASGASSFGKKLAGSLLVVVGALLIGASIAALVATCGSSSLLSAWGVALGLSLLHTQVIAGIGFSLTAVAGAGLTFWGGSIFKAGMRQGFSQKLVDVQEAVNNPPAHGM